MAGSPLKRQRRKELRCIQPHIPAHEWRTFSDTEKIAAIFGMSLDEVHELMSIPFAEADLHERNLKLRVFECLMRVGLKFADLNKRAAERQQMLEALEAALDERATERATARDRYSGTNGTSLAQPPRR
jgi:hypothetical protein